MNFPDGNVESMSTSITTQLQDHRYSDNHRLRLCSSIEAELVRALKDVQVLPELAGNRATQTAVTLRQALNNAKRFLKDFEVL